MSLNTFAATAPEAGRKPRECRAAQDSDYRSTLAGGEAGIAVSAPIHDVPAAIVVAPPIADAAPVSPPVVNAGPPIIVSAAIPASIVRAICHTSPSARIGRDHSQNFTHVSFSPALMGTVASSRA